MAESRRRLSPDDRRNELLALGAEVFGQRPYDEVRIDEIAELPGVSRALMYHYFPDKRAFFAAVVRPRVTGSSRPPTPRRCRIRTCSSSCVRVCWPTCATTRNTRTARGPPTSAWAVRPGVARHRRHRQRPAGRPDPGQHRRDAVGDLDSKVERDLRITVYGWLAFTIEICRQRIIDPSIDAGQVADACAHALLDAVGRVPGIPAELTRRSRPSDAE